MENKFENILSLCFKLKNYEVGSHLCDLVRDMRLELSFDVLKTMMNLYLKQEKHEDVLYCLKKIFMNSKLTESELYDLKDIMKLCVNDKGVILSKDYTIYKQENIDNMSSILKFNRSKDNKQITLTMTTCKRLDLFCKTVNSVLECFKDKELIDEWIVVDDNSSEEDRKQMIKLYPFITFIFKNLENKGHPRSMNIIKSFVQTPYIFHLEDDFVFFIKDNYLTKCLNVLDENQEYGQCLVNKNYGEDLDAHAIGGGFMKFTKDGQRYYVHEHYSGEELNRFHETIVKQGKRNVAYWPHFSFRVGLTRMRVLNELGNFAEGVEHFERDYALRYIKKYKTTFLDNSPSIHIGRKTYERGTEIKNAYELNEEIQFDKNEKKTINQLPEQKILQNISSKSSNKPPIHLPPIPEDKELPKETPIIKLPLIPEEKISQNISSGQQENKYNSSKVVLKEHEYSIMTRVINLERRPDRALNFIERNHNDLLDLNYQFHKGVDGQNLIFNNKIYKLFQTGDFNYRKGIVGCALSHLEIWYEFLNRPEELCMIFEDDVKILHKFFEKLLHSLKLMPLKDGQADWDVLYLGHLLYPQCRTPQDIEDKMPNVERKSVEECLKISMGGLHSYIITKRGVRFFLKELNNKGMYNAIDWVMFRTECVAYYCYPFMTYANCVQVDGVIDSDINYKTDPDGITEDIWMKDEIKYWNKRLNTNTISLKNPNEIMNKMKDLFNVKEKSNIILSGTFNEQDFEDNIVIIENTKEHQDKLISKEQLYYDCNKFLVVVSHKICNKQDLDNITFKGFLHPIYPR